ncbi:MAG: cyclic nucleotide-binding domain-containing protein [Desulfobulbaceae bacterium]|nr:cyclic nucleotide-binding domain-containing protein [Desulfobulbaceae bacterium]
MPDSRNLDLRKDKTALLLALEKISFFDTLEAEEMKVLMDFMSLYELSAGDVLFREGQMGQYVAFVVAGTMEVLKKSITGANIVITTVGQGYSIGEMSLIDAAARSATLQARTQATLAILAQNAFKLILQKHPTIGIKILTGFARFQTENLRKTSNRLNAYTHLLSTICNQKGLQIGNKIEEQLLKDGANLVRETHSISSLSSSVKFFKNLKKILTTDLLE